MKRDSSRRLYTKYFSLATGRIEVVLKNGRRLKGTVCGFFKGNVDQHEPYIRQWHIVAEDEKYNFGLDGFGFRQGEIINQRDIVSVYFDDDQTMMIF